MKIIKRNGTEVVFDIEKINIIIFNFFFVFSVFANTL